MGEVAVFQGLKPSEEIFATEIGISTKEPYLLSIGFTNWSPRSDVAPQPYIEAGCYTEHNKLIVGGIHAGYKNEAILGYAYDFKINNGAGRRISKAARKTRLPSDSPGISLRIFK